MINDNIGISAEAIKKYLGDVPYDVTRTKLYSAADLYGTDNYDANVYKHYLTTRNSNNPLEKLAQCLHDFGIQKSLDDFLSNYKQKQVVGVMGGHGLLRTEGMFKEIVHISKSLTEKGYIMISGGGPGAMEATHLGAWMAGRTHKDIEDVLGIISVAPSFGDEGWLDTAFEVMKKYPQEKFCSLGVPTWLYGHEPSTPFATHIAKFFENSIREDDILTIAYGGIIYSPGSAGTMQEIFQDAVQNHYLSFGYSSPMIFLGTKFWGKEMPVYPLLQDMMNQGKYKNLLLSLTDHATDVIETVEKFNGNV